MCLQLILKTNNGKYIVICKIGIMTFINGIIFFYNILTIQLYFNNYVIIMTTKKTDLHSTEIDTFIRFQDL